MAATINTNAAGAVDAMRAFSTSITAQAFVMNEQVPYVTVSNFSAQAEEYLAIMKTPVIYYSPILWTSEDRLKWEQYSVDNMLRNAADTPVSKEKLLDELSTDRVSSHIYHIDFLGPEQPGPHPPAKATPPWMPLWQDVFSTRGSEEQADDENMPYFINLNVASLDFAATAIQTMNQTRSGVITEVLGLNHLFEDPDVAIHPLSFLIQPVFKDFRTDHGNVDGSLFTIFPWIIFFFGLLADGTPPIHIVISNTCGQVFTYRINGSSAEFISVGATTYYEHLEQIFSILPFQAPEGSDICSYSMSIYPTEELHDQYITNTSLIFTSIVVMVFLFTSSVFLVYDHFVQRRQRVVLDSAERTGAIVSDLFPSKFRSMVEENQMVKRMGEAPTKALADLFPDTTIMVADIQGFTAWSSMREPSQVFTLLETIYGAFDRLAKQRRIFKVETVGDSYVAVAGLPTPRPNHAVVMARFAQACIRELRILLERLEVVLGPGTASLGMRFGLHSGPVTAGILRGDKARFQLFGGSINMAARIEATGVPNSVHMSQATKDALEKSGKGHWAVKRKTKVFAKGIGEIETYMLKATTSQNHGSCRSDDSATMVAEQDVVAIGSVDDRKSRINRLVEWNSNLLLDLLRQVIAASQHKRGISKAKLAVHESKAATGEMVLDEVRDIITLPQFDSTKLAADPESIEIPTKVKDQMYAFVRAIADSYHNNAFHNFEHASHVSMSVHKLLSRIVAPSRPDLLPETENETISTERSKCALELHDHTHGITSDPLTQFGIVLSALIHDVEHTGVSNGQLIEEDAVLAAKYKNKSVAEQNSVDVAWDILFQDNFSDLRSCIYADQDDLQRFRQIVVNSVLATDIFDKELGALRKNRWQVAFSEEKLNSRKAEDVNRKATIVIEHIIQASDVSHTMQVRIVCSRQCTV